jgi:hypothetical protein
MKWDDAEPVDLFCTGGAVGAYDPCGTGVENFTVYLRSLRVKLLLEEELGVELSFLRQGALPAAASAGRGPF